MNTGGKMKGLYRQAAETLGLFIGIIVVWQLLTSTFQALYFPTPWTIAQKLNGWLSWSALQEKIFPSLIRVTIGFGLASVAGVALGVAIGLWRGLSGFVEPVIHFFRAVPPPAVLPIFMIFFGIGHSMKVLFIAFGVIWPILINTIKGVQSIDQTQIDSARIFGITGARYLFRVIIPAASPEIFAGLRISLALSFILMVISEMISASGGIGFEILNSQANFDIINMWAGMVVLGLCGIIFSSLLSLIENRLLHWQRGARGKEQ